MNKLAYDLGQLMAKLPFRHKEEEKSVGSRIGSGLGYGGAGLVGGAALLGGAAFIPAIRKMLLLGMRRAGSAVETGVKGMGTTGDVIRSMGGSSRALADMGTADPRMAKWMMGTMGGMTGGVGGLGYGLTKD